MDSKKKFAFNKNFTCDFENIDKYDLRIKIIFEIKNDWFDSATNNWAKIREN